MGLDVDVKLRFVVKGAEGEICDDGERLFALLKELAAGGIRVLEPMRVVRLARLDQLQCTVDSFLRTKTGFERFLNKRKFEKTHLPTLCRKYSIEAEVWTSCGEAGYDEHFVIGYDGKVLAKESFDTTPNCACCEANWKPGREEAEWSANWGKWVIPLRSEYEARKLSLQERRDESPAELPF
jgi:hypothetical protein